VVSAEVAHLHRSLQPSPRREMGAGLVKGDLGIHASTLPRLACIPGDTVTIDTSRVAGLGTKAGHQTSVMLIAGNVVLAFGLQLPCVAESVQNRDHRRSCRHLVRQQAQLTARRFSPLGPLDSRVWLGEQRSSPGGSYRLDPGRQRSHADVATG
jgi:predicted signal transduction protein with EAL and GGDEF domain